MKKLFALAILALMSNLAGGAEVREPQVGEDAPPLGLETILQAPAGSQASWESLKGKVVVLEFWATWCGPCIGAIPHLNEMADQFKDQPIQFIAITDENEALITSFLKKKPMRAWVGLDTDRSMFKDYAIGGIPHTVVVDRDGKIAAITHPSQLTARHLEDVLAGRKPALSQPVRGIRADQVPATAKPQPEPLFQVLIRPSETTSMSSASSAGALRFSGSSVLDVLAACYDVRPGRVSTNCPLPEGRFEFVIKTPTNQTAVVHDWLRRAIENTFGLTARRETREADALVLTAGTHPAEHLSPTVSTGGSSGSSGGGSLNGVNLGMDSLAASLEGFLGKPVIDETQLTNRYDFQLLWEEAGPEEGKRIVAAVREQLGLELTLAKRPIEVLVVEAAKEQAK